MTEENGILKFRTVFSHDPVPDSPELHSISEWGKRLCESGMVEGTDGNLSFRTKNGFVVSGTGVRLDEMNSQTVAEVIGLSRRNDIIFVTINGSAPPSREAVLHARVYEAHPEVNAIFHIHDRIVMRQAEPLLIPVTATEWPPGSMELVDEAVRLMASVPETEYFILRNHGVIAMAANIDAAGESILQMRQAADKLTR